MAKSAAFQRTSEEGEKAVRRLIQLFFGSNMEFTILQRNADGSRDFDLKYNNDSARVEVKNEDKQTHTGNICVEMYQGIPKKESGILASESTVVIHTLINKAVVYRTINMIRHINDELNARRLRFRSFGDNNNEGVIIPIFATVPFTSWFRYIDFDDIPKQDILFKMPKTQVQIPVKARQVQGTLF